jgi:hypothetical protein
LVRYAALTANSALVVAPHRQPRRAEHAKGHWNQPRGSVGDSRGKASWLVPFGVALAWLACSIPAAAQSWTPPRNAFGQPDLEGVWLSNAATPLERPKALEGRDRLTDAEVAEFRRRAARLFREDGDSDFAVGDGIFQALLGDPVRYTNPNSTHGADGMIDLVFDNRTSLVVNRPDGRLPATTAEGRRRQQAAAAAFRDPFVPADTGGPLRCLTWGTPRLGGRYGSGDMSYYQIVQAPDHVVLYAEAGHEARIIPLDGRPHVRPALTQWGGDSRGRWDGATLVVETANFSSSSFFMGAAEHLRLTERFTRTGPDTIHYEITVNDPTTWTEPWAAMLPLQRRQELLYEFACHEGNYHLMRGMLDGARAIREAAREGTTR